MKLWYWKRNWKILLVALFFGIALGVGLFAWVHRWEPGFTNLEPAGVIVDYDPIHTIIHAQLSGVGAFFGALIGIGGATLLSLPKRISEFWVMRRSGFALAIIGVAVVCASSLQTRYDSIYPSAAAIDELTHACAETGKRPCMTLPEGDR
jgi:hypothetical protein